MLVVTTPTVEGAPIKRYIGMVSGETIAGVNVFKDFGASLSNMFGGRASQYEEEIGNASATAVNEMCARAQSMGANAVVGVKVDYFTAGSDNGMLAAIATGDDARGLPAGRRLCVPALWLGGEGERAGDQVKEHRSIATKVILN